MKEKKNLIFYYPSRTIGGAQLLFVRLANRLSQRNDFKVSLIDYDDGFLKNNSENTVEVITFQDGKNYNFDSNAVVLVPISMILSINDIVKLAPGGRYLFWGIHPENTIDILRGASRLKGIFRKPDPMIKLINFFKYKKIKKQIELGLKNNSVVFMDEANKNRTCEFYKLSKGPWSYIPIPIAEAPDFEMNYDENNKKNVAWLGRLSTDKIHSLLFALNKLNDYGAVDFHIHIIGDGPCIDKINNFSGNKITITHHGYVANEQLGKILVEHEIGLAIGMGTSILETAMMKIPSLLIDPSYHPLVNDYSPSWLFEARGFTLGSFKHRRNIKSFDAYIAQLMLENDNSIGSDCFDYAQSNHSMEQVIDKIERQIKTIDL
jgi:glycosyltransferase involved in cell wall biosynthesis